MDKLDTYNVGIDENGNYVRFRICSHTGEQIDTEILESKERLNDE